MQDRVKERYLFLDCGGKTDVIVDMRSIIKYHKANIKIALGSFISVYEYNPSVVTARFIQNWTHFFMLLF
jgi:hypothetical protein